MSDRCRACGEIDTPCDCREKKVRELVAAATRLAKECVRPKVGRDNKVQWLLWAPSRAAIDAIDAAIKEVKG